MSDIDHLIIGQGLAGSLLGWHLQKQGRRVLLVDDEHLSSSSTVAAGLINPLAGLRYVLPPRIDEWIASLEQTYRELSQQFDDNFHYKIDTVRLFRNEEQISYWQRRADEPRAAAYLGKRFEAEQSHQPIKAPSGGFFQHETGYVDLPALLKALKGHFIRKQSYRSTHLEYQELHVDGGEIQWHDIRANNIIFCEGYKSSTNPWFHWLPFTPTKGEFLKIAGTFKKPDKIINSGHILVPLTDGSMRFGATYDRAVFDNIPTEEAREELLEGVAKILPTLDGLEVLEQKAGVRPITQDKAPFIGHHPQYPQIMIFNGFGAKGTLEIPWYAKKFADYLQNKGQGNGSIPKEANIERHYPKAP